MPFVLLVALWAIATMLAAPVGGHVHGELLPESSVVTEAVADTSTCAVRSRRVRRRVVLGLHRARPRPTVRRRRPLRIAPPPTTVDLARPRHRGPPHTV